VLHFIERFFEPLLRLLLPPPGRHRAGGAPAVVGEVDPPTLVLPRGVDELVRPYMLANGQPQSRMHGVEVAG
jgi:hypothetical protein